ncbi:ASCH domain-containing protein [Piscicoccus intestinalis]|uniref:ASCH domain-containing protein n=1 Tax=Piscicoccus intestinalis TaxID=746033 RepID=UPI0008381756|nr:ASCH domain-containing protein [Piscicoccus intestinalis]
MNQDEIDDFWTDAKVRAALNPASAYTGPNPADSVPPPAWSFGATPQEADELLALVLDGTKTATASALWDYEPGELDDELQHELDELDDDNGEEDGLPSSGDLSIVLDGAGHPRALIRTTDVRIVPFGEVDEEHARAEGEGDRSLTHWRAVHERFFREHADHEKEFSPTMPVVLERFEVLVPVELRPDQPSFFGRG